MAALFMAACKPVRLAKILDLRHWKSISLPTLGSRKSLPTGPDNQSQPLHPSSLFSGHENTRSVHTQCGKQSLARTFPLQWAHLLRPSAAVPSCFAHRTAVERPQVRWKHGGGMAGGEQMRDTILLKGLVFHGYHGVLEEERRLGQKFVVDIEASADLARAGRTDDLADTVNYAAVYQDVRDIVEGPPRLLLETVAQSIADVILGRYSKVDDLTITVKKPHVAIHGTCEYLGIRIHRTRVPGA
ncbi:dihydroneopterin aldolase [Klebsormidium nitens]|uniref:7,8-dihydroneopterin aldolase n=1 Tax=Klebsormidium nitens TaxID=105231 RepID=A0A1Y1IA90_KLENI|nr:dihydroneopterin aldolase [Klebsormidium nitens]|eukprot:GAQ85018.1 dihydroneopterin aldolase [Klebsormidium nitens]